MKKELCECNNKGRHETFEKGECDCPICNGRGLVEIKENAR